jgi:hypothetical protein
MIEFLALLVLLVLLNGAIICCILSVYSNVSLREAWSWTWSKAWAPVLLTIADLLARF